MCDYYRNKAVNMIEIAKSVRAAHTLILINVVLWLIFAVLAALGRLPAGLSTNLTRWIIAILSLGTSAALGGISLLLLRRKKGAFYLASGLLVLVGLCPGTFTR
jgi:hypothetical protein